MTIKNELLKIFVFLGVIITIYSSINLLGYHGLPTIQIIVYTTTSLMGLVLCAICIILAYKSY